MWRRGLAVTVISVALRAGIAARLWWRGGEAGECLLAPTVGLWREPGGSVRGAVRPVLIVVDLVPVQDPPQMGLVPDEGAVQELASCGPAGQSTPRWDAM
jgi:hypothetical protein